MIVEALWLTAEKVEFVENDYEHKIQRLEAIEKQFQIILDYLVEQQKPASSKKPEKIDTASIQTQTDPVDIIPSPVTRAADSTGGQPSQLVASPLRRSTVEDNLMLPEERNLSPTVRLLNFGEGNSLSPLTQSPAKSPSDCLGKQKLEQARSVLKLIPEKIHSQDVEYLIT